MTTVATPRPAGIIDPVGRPGATKGVEHYGTYNKASDQARKEATAWFDEPQNAATAAPNVNE
jgi:hypothetical protein